MQRRPHADLQRGLEIVAAHRLERTDPDDTGIVDEHVDRPQAPATVADPASDLLTVGDIAGRRNDDGAATAQIVRSLFQLVGVARTNSQTCAARSQMTS